MKQKVLSSMFNSYSSDPSWTLILQCGHTTLFTGKNKSLTKCPEGVECEKCGTSTEQTKPNLQEIDMAKHMIQLVIGSVVMLDCTPHVCVSVVGKNAILYRKDSKTVKDANAPFGFTTVAAPVMEKSVMNEYHFYAPLTKEQFVPMTHEQIVKHLIDNEVSQVEARVPAKKAEKPLEASNAVKPAHILRALGKNGITSKQGKEIAARHWPEVKYPDDHIREGRKGVGKIADLTVEQLQSYIQN